MFDISFGKLAILFTLCLVVLGPEKLPKLAQQLGRWTGQARAMARHFRAQLEQEIATEQLMKEKRELEAAVQSGIDAAASPVQTLAKTVDEAKDSMTLSEFGRAQSEPADSAQPPPAANAPADHAASPEDTQRPV